MKKYWVASARGCDFKVLESHGFLVFYPALDDYAFLEEVEGNKHFLSASWQERLRIKFMRSGDGILAVTEDSLREMFSLTKDVLVPGAIITVVDGYCSGLEGVIKEREGDKLRCTVKGYKQFFEVELKVTEVSLKTAA